MCIAARKVSLYGRKERQSKGNRRFRRTNSAKVLYEKVTGLNDLGSTEVYSYDESDPAAIVFHMHKSFEKSELNDGNSLKAIDS